MKQNRKPYVTRDEFQQELNRVEAKLHRLHADHLERVTAHGSSIAAQATAKYGRKRRKGKGPDSTPKGAPSRV